MPKVFQPSSPSPQPNVPAASRAETPVTVGSSVNNDLVVREHASLGEQSGGKNGLPLVRMISMLLFIFVVVAAYFVYFVMIPKSQAGDYYAQTSGDFKKIKEELATLNKGSDSAFSDSSSSFEISKGIYFDISQSFDYSEALVDAKRDLDNVKKVQQLIAQSRSNKGKFRAGGDVGDLGKFYSKYLDRQEEGMGKLYLYENFRVEMLIAIGDEYSRELNKLLGIYNFASPREERVEYIENLIKLSDAARARLGGLSAIPDDSRQYYDVTALMYGDLAETLVQILADLKIGNSDGDNAAVSRFVDFNKRQVDRYSKIREITVNIVANSSAGSVFREAVSYEEKTQAEIDKLKDEYGSGD